MTAATSIDSTPLDNAGHLRRALDVLELRLRREVLLARAERGAAGRFDEFAGLVISDEEIDSYLAPAGEGAAPSGHATNVVELDARRKAAEGVLEEAVARAVQAGQWLRLPRVCEAFALSAADAGALLACLAPELDVRFERYYAYLQNDLGRKRPTVQLLGRLWPERDERIAPLPRLVFLDTSMVSLRLLEPVKDADDGWAGRQLRVAPGLLGFLCGGNQPDPELRELGRWRGGRPLPEGGSYFRHHRETLERLLSLAERDDRLPCAFLRAPEACGKEDVVLALAHRLDAAVFELAGDELLTVGASLAEWLRVLERNLRLRGAFLWIRRADVLLEAGDAQRACLRVLGNFLRQRPGVNLLFTGQRGSSGLGEGLQMPTLEVTLPAPETGERAELWRRSLDGVLPGDSRLPDELAAKFKLGPGKIAAALRRLQWEEQKAEGLEQSLHGACRSESNQTLKDLAQKLPTRYRWDDLVLPPGVLEQLQEIRNAVRFRTRVHAEWGFGHKFSLGRGTGVLFSGASGTGKTMSAEVLAGELGLDLFKIDLAQVVSKYIGETEKNLDRIFREAESGNCILLFDEADALFGKRSEVKDAHDRYANIEVNFLLGRMDDYEGIVILTTNMLKNLDPAFTRRMHYTVEFPVPDERHRGLLWSKVFPADTPRAPDLDLEFLAKRFKLSGANIKNIALGSAFLAASNGGVVDMAHVITALKREYRKMGKLASRSEFGPYYQLGHDEAEGEA